MARVSRRATLLASVAGLAGLFMVGGTGAPARANPRDGGAEEALALLRQGNLRWQRAAAQHPNTDPEHRADLVAGQQPFAVVLGCADSRVPPERVFDRGLGDLFTVRSAGQVLDTAVLGSITFAVRHLATPLVVVLGHASCGAVSAAVESHRGGTLPEGHVGELVEPLLPVVESTPDTGTDFVDDCVTANARDIAEQLRGDPELRPFVGSGALRITPARYELDSGAVEFLT